MTLVLALFRLAWGVVGTRHARFTAFVRGPVAVWRYVRAVAAGAPPAFAGHNPAGGWMVLFLLLGLTCQATLGMFASDDILNEGPFHPLVGPALGRLLSSWHRRLFWLLAAAVALHVAAVLAHRLLWRERLIGAMIHGRKDTTGEAIAGSAGGRAAALLAALAALLYGVLRLAPADGGDFD
jgi:cytochrome b